VATNIKLINYHIEELQKIDNLSERTKNVCFEDSLDTLYKILSYYRENGTFRKIRNCGLKTDLELISLSEKYLKLAEENQEDISMSEEDERFENLKLYCYSHFRVPSEITAQYKDSFTQKKFPFFSFLQTIMQYELNEREKFIFANNYGFKIGLQKRTLQTIGDQYGITRERVRQIAQRVPDKIQDAVKSLAKKFPFLHTHFDYGIDLKRDFILLNEESTSEINKREDLQFTPKFYGFVFAELYHKNFFSFQEIDTHYKSYYLINLKLHDSFDFKAFHEDVAARIDKRIEQTYYLDFNEYLTAFSHEGNAVPDKTASICKKILLEEFGFNLEKGKIVFARNTMVKLSEYILDILEHSGRPMKLKEICKELKTRTMKIPPNIESLRSSILSIEEVVAIGKTSTYSLRKWDTVKTGTIKEIVIEYLEKHNEPKHIADITIYVNTFRKTSDKNILSNLKLDRTNTFQFFKKSFIGLKSKTYRAGSNRGSQLKLL
jgi:hypothetical protein